MVYEVIHRSSDEVTLSLAPGDYAINAQGEYLAQVKDSHGVLYDLDVGDRLSPFSRQFVVTEPITLVLTPRCEVSIFKTVADPLHSWTRTYPPHTAGIDDFAVGPEFVLDTGHYRIESPMLVAVSVCTSDADTAAADRQWSSVAYENNRFIVPVTATYRIEYPRGGKGSTKLYLEN